MGSFYKSFLLLLIMLLAVSSAMKAKPAFAQTLTPSPTPLPTPMPSVPEFTLKFVDNSYNVPPATISLTDPYTGKTTTATNPGYRVENLTIEVTIKNQPFALSYRSGEKPYTSFGFYYNIRIKGHYEENWTDLYNAEEGYAPPSNSEYTMISLSANNYPSGGQVDLQVQAMIGYPTGALPPYDPFTYQFVGETSSWSPTQTVTIPVTSLSPAPTPSTSTLSPTPTPTSTSANSASYTSLLLIALAAIAFSVAIVILLLLYMRKRKTISAESVT